MTIRLVNMKKLLTLVSNNNLKLNLKTYKDEN